MGKLRGRGITTDIRVHEYLYQNAVNVEKYNCMSENLDLFVAPGEASGICPLGITNACTNFYCNSSRR